MTLCPSLSQQLVTVVIRVLNRTVTDSTVPAKVAAMTIAIPANSSGLDQLHLSKLLTRTPSSSQETYPDDLVGNASLLPSLFA